MSHASEQTIHEMDDILASQVAAGEVVERPASIVKELVENSLDAGAHTIRVDIQRGGIAGIKVSDDGSGMSRTDLALCLRRHATSKLTTFVDLFNIRHMGFRGEALPSIASVAHMRICTRRAQDIEGSQLSCHGGDAEEIIAVGCPPGTEIEVSDLFYNTPVRRKFLKSVETEAGHIEHQLKLHALAFPAVRFIFTRDGQQVFDTPATHDPRRRIADIAGRDLAEKLLRIRPIGTMGVQVSGYLSPLADAHRNKRLQFVFLNSRPIEDKIITRAVRDGYGGFPSGSQPPFFLYLEMEPSLVDVNVHPAKREVRFRRPSDVTLAISDAIAATLTDHARGATPRESEPDTPAIAPHLHPDAHPEVSAQPRQIPPPTQPQPPFYQDPPGSDTPRVFRPKHTPSYVLPPGMSSRIQPELENNTAEQAEEATPPPLRLSIDPQQQSFPLDDDLDDDLPEPSRSAPFEGNQRFRSMGCMRDQYALFESPEGLTLLSLRAARERILFERLLEANKRPVPAQRLLTPAFIDLDSRVLSLAKELQPLLTQAGFIVSSFGTQTLRIEAIPIFLDLDKVDAFILELISTYTSGETRLRRNSNPFRHFASHLARQYVRREDISPWLANPMPLLTDLLCCENPYCTALGKPTMLPFPLSEIQRRFQAR